MLWYANTDSALVDIVIIIIVITFILNKNQQNNEARTEVKCLMIASLKESITFTILTFVNLFLFALVHQINKPLLNVDEAFPGRVIWHFQVNQIPKHDTKIMQEHHKVISLSQFSHSEHLNF